MITICHKRAFLNKIEGKIIRKTARRISFLPFMRWQTDLTQCTSEEQLPQAFLDYITFLEKELETPISIISVGPDRAQTITRKQ